jgi:hypothetical protein
MGSETAPQAQAQDALDAFLDTASRIRADHGPASAREFLEATRDLLIRVFPVDLGTREHFYAGDRVESQIARTRWLAEEHQEDEWESHEVEPGHALLVIEGCVVRHTKKAIGFWTESGTIWIPKSIMQGWEQVPVGEGEWVNVWPVQEWWIVTNKHRRRHL